MEAGIRNELNFRQLGGYEMTDGRKVRNGLLLRSGGLHLFMPEELEIVKKYRISSVLDLRAWYDWKKKPDPDIGGHHLVYDGRPSRGGEQIDFSARGFSQCGEAGEKQLAKLKDYYAGMPFGNDGYRAMMRAILRQDVPLLFHCTTGKDRTGIAAMVVLYALGADDAVMMADYLLSNEYRRACIEDFLKPENLRDPEDEACRKLAFMRGGVLEEMGRCALEEIHKRYDSPEAYVFNEFEWNKNELEEVRNRYLEET